jgi:hypothetical protein
LGGLQNLSERDVGKNSLPPARDRTDIDIDIDERIILKLMLEKCDVRM